MFLWNDFLHFFLIDTNAEEFTLINCVTYIITKAMIFLLIVVKAALFSPVFAKGWETSCNISHHFCSGFLLLVALCFLFFLLYTGELKVKKYQIQAFWIQSHFFFFLVYYGRNVQYVAVHLEPNTPDFSVIQLFSQAKPRATKQYILNQYFTVIKIGVGRDLWRLHIPASYLKQTVAHPRWV